MFNPPSSFPNSGSHEDLLKRLTRRVQQSQVDHETLGILQRVFENELNKEQLVLSRPERQRLFQQVTKAVLDEMLGNIGSAE